MGRYSKSYSNFIYRKKHQNVTDGVILERDWVTFGNVHRLEPGKKPFFSDSNFIFTDNNLPFYKKKHGYGEWVAHFVYDDVKDAIGDVNQVKVNRDSDDLRSYAYYGSMEDLVRGSVENIINYFPGRMKSSLNKLSVLDEDTWINTGKTIISNPFAIDMHSENVIVNEYDNPLHYMSSSWDKYIVATFNGEGERETESPIVTYEIKNAEYEILSSKKYYDMGYRYLRYKDTLFKWDTEEERYVIVTYSEDCKNYFVKCDEYLKYRDVYYMWSYEDGQYVPIDVYEICNDNYQKVYTITITTEDGEEYVVDAYKIEGSFVYCSFTDNLIIEPNSQTIESYFNNLEGFERKLLNRNTRPAYTNKILVPYQLSNGAYTLVHRTFVWPASGYCIDIESPSYLSFLSNLVDVAVLYDEVYCDNLWRCMTHESIKNFDWTYRREYTENDAAENIEGGNRMRTLINFYGRIYDEAKRYVDGIRFTNNVTYDGYDNLDNAEISDKNDIKGWDIVSTIWEPYYYREIRMEDIPENTRIVPLPFLPSNVYGNSPEYISIGCNDNCGKIERYCFDIGEVSGKLYTDAYPINTDNLNSYSYSQILYNKTLLHDQGFERGVIKSISLHGRYNGLGIFDPEIHLQVFIGVTDTSNIDYDWIRDGDLRLVYDGDTTLPREGTIDIPFNTNYEWDGEKNILLAIRNTTPNRVRYYYFAYNNDTRVVGGMTHVLNEGIINLDKTNIPITGTPRTSDQRPVITMCVRVDIPTEPLLYYHKEYNDPSLQFLADEFLENENYIVGKYDSWIRNTHNQIYVLMQCTETESGCTCQNEPPSGAEVVEMDSVPEIASDNDPEYIKVGDKYYHRAYVAYVEVDSDPRRGFDNFWNERNTFIAIPSIITSGSLQYIRVINNNFYRYYILTDAGFNNDNYTHQNWFNTHNPNVTTPMSCDINFQRKLFLSCNRIFKTKGTRQSIDMVMGMFGYGSDNGDYSLREYYHTTKPKKLDEKFYFYEYIDEEPDGVIWVVGVNVLNTLEKAIVDIGETSQQYIRIDHDDVSDYYVLNSDYTFEEVVLELYRHRTTERLYDDYYTGVPLGNITLGNTNYVIPYYTKSRTYEGFLYFQQKGGWEKHSDDPDQQYDYSETVPYMHMVQNVSALLGVFPDDIRENDIYYVMDTSDYVEFDEDVPFNLSHFFKSTDKYNPQLFSSWKNVPMEGEIVYNTNYENDGITHEDYVHAKYLNDIIPTIYFNNPHTGIGNYDMGRDFYNYIKQPYKYAFDTYNFDEGKYMDMARQFLFELDHYIASENDEKLVKWLNTMAYYYEDGVLRNEVVPFDEEKYFINNKLFVLRNNIDNVFHRKFMKDVVLKYVLQVIPSTAILILENFDEPMSGKADYYYINVVSDKCCEEVTGQGEYMDTTMAVLRAVPRDGCHFVRWENEYGDTVSTNPVTQVMVCCNTTYHAVCEEDCIILTNCTTTCPVSIGCQEEALCSVALLCDVPETE